jgi:outer membrane receptor protein involved in Fe transport
LRVHGVLSSLLSVALALGVTFAGAGPAAAQTPGGSISGTVASGTGDPIVGATVSLSGPVSGQSVTTNSTGAFTFSGLPDGKYYVTITHAGYQALRATPVTIVAGAPQTLSVTLVQQTLTSLRTIGSTATTGGRGSTALNTTGAAQTTVTSQQFLDLGQTQVMDLLEDQPGIELDRSDSGALGANVALAIRGTNTYESQVLIDGHPVMGGDYGDYLLQFLNPIMLQDVEVNKGPGSFGNIIQNAVGGTVNFRTWQIAQAPTGTLLAGYNSYNGSLYGARFSETVGKFGFLVGYAFDGTPGYFNGTIYSVDTGGASSIPGQPAPPAVINMGIPATETYQNRSELLKAAYNFSSTTSLQLGYYGSQSYVDYTATLGSVEPYTIVGSLGPDYTNPAYGNLIGHTIYAASFPDDGVYLGNFEQDSEPIFTADLRTAFGGGTFLGRFYTGSIDRVITDPGEVTQISACLNPTCSGPGGVTYDGTDFTEDESDLLRGYDFEYDLPVGVSTLTASYDWHSDKTGFTETGEPADTISGLDLRSQTISIRGIFPLTPRLTLGIANYFNNATFVGNHWDPDGYLMWKPNNRQTVRFAAGTSFVAPPGSFVTKVAGASGTDSSALIENGVLHVVDSLRPEYSGSFDLGTDYRIGSDSKVTLDLYNTIIDNRFATITLRPGVGDSLFYNGTPITEIEELYNQSDSHEQGIELQYLKQPRVGFGGSLAFDFLRAYNFDTNTGIAASILSGTSAQTGAFNGLADELDGHQIPGFPYSHGRGELNYRFPSGALVAFGMTYYGDWNSFGETAFELFDAHVRIPLNGGFSLLVSGTNLFDHDDGRDLYEYGYGQYFLPAAPGVSPYNESLLFAPPRTVTVQLSHPL